MLTGKRGGFGAMLPTLQQINQEPDLELQLVVTDQHVNSKFGRTIAEVEERFKIAAAVDMEQAGDSGADRARALGTCLTRMAGVLADLNPDVVVLYGDRGEVLATAVAAMNLGKPIFHIQGGDISGTLDDLMRHAITKLANIHLVSTKESAERLLRMGEEDWRIHIVGDLHVDPIVNGYRASAQEVVAAFSLNLDKAILVVLQHPDTLEPDQAFCQMNETLAALATTQHQIIVVYPCSDQGHDGIIRAINKYVHLPKIQVHKNIEAPLFLGLLQVSSVLIGNSSAGLIETPYFPIPAINIGSRQHGRIHAENVIHAPYERNAILKAIDIALNDAAFHQKVLHCRRPFGEGQSYRRVVNVIRNTVIEQRLFVKRMTF
ncbi:UDP-N-acetylglucosamine 2-epimerase [Nitrospiraceae bacterium AH_259_D15_M11_P09]|nr:UDP-N-acetylglucosamine 2-epimerase [Nitrospiraceae bacterium AH_259_D15_M11_P09]